MFRNEILLFLILSCLYSSCNAQFRFSGLDALKNIKSYSREYLPPSIVDSFETVSDIFINAIQEECVFRCPGGIKPKPNKYYEPVSNGCGVEKLNLNPKFVPIKKVTQCCNEHDVCYGTCNKKMDKCDEKFKQCLDDSCSLLKDIVSNEIYEACKTGSFVIYGAINKLGCKYYKDAQKKACMCGSHDEL